MYIDQNRETIVYSTMFFLLYMTADEDFQYNNFYFRRCSEFFLSEIFRALTDKFGFEITITANKYENKIWVLVWRFICSF